MGLSFYLKKLTMKKVIFLMLTGYALSLIMFMCRIAVVDFLRLPASVYTMAGLVSGVAFYLLVNTPAEGSENNRQYQVLAFVLAVVYAFGAFGDYSPVALLSTGPIIAGCAAALRQPADNTQITLKNGWRFWAVSAVATLIGIGIASIWQPVLSKYPFFLWFFGGSGLLAEAIAQIGYTANVLNAREFRRAQALASEFLLVSCLAQSNSGSVAFNIATLASMALFTLTDKENPSPP